MTITISPGNTKLGMIPSFSLSFASCPKYAKGTGCWHYCYARRLAYLRPTFRRSLERNYRQVKDLKKLESLLTIEIPKNTRSRRFLQSRVFLYVDTPCEEVQAQDILCIHKSLRYRF
jgi:hypothetical protein